MVALVLSVLALLVALTAAALAFAVMRQSGAVASTLHRHRLGHELRDGQLDPQVSSRRERREINLGAPRAGERRVPTAPAPEVTPGQLAIGEAEPATAAMPMTNPRLPRPGEIGRP